MTTAIPDLRRTLDAQGFAHVEAPAMRALLGAEAWAEWPAFAATWEDLGPDLYMADGGRYRRRRHAAFRVAGGKIERKPHQPHYQSRDYNRLNGGVQRWFEPVGEIAEASAVTRRVLGLCDALFSMGPAEWHVEFHQFRIEAQPGEVGHPTPEGLHRDGVDWAFVMLVERRNVAEGVTQIGTPQGAEIGRFTLAAPGDAVVLDDRRTLHGVTPIHPLDPARPAYRDVLVVTFAKA